MNCLVAMTSNSTCKKVSSIRTVYKHKCCCCLLFVLHSANSQNYLPNSGKFFHCDRVHFMNTHVCPFKEHASHHRRSYTKLKIKIELKKKKMIPIILNPWTSDFPFFCISSILCFYRHRDFGVPDERCARIFCFVRPKQKLCIPNRFYKSVYTSEFSITSWMKKDLLCEQDSNWNVSPEWL